jgi:YD repeat-containing protein
VTGKPSDITIANHGGTKIKESQYYYDGLALGNVSAGNLTKEQDWKGGSTYITAFQNTYNGYGLVIQQLDPRNNTTTYAYDTYTLYPATVTDAISQATAYQYDYSTGKTTQTTDANSNLFRTVYDGLGRPLATITPDPANPGSNATSTAYAYIDTANAVSVHESDYLSAAASVDTYTYYDGLNRPVQSRKSSESGGTYKVTDRVYNNLGHLQKESLPYFASGSAKSAPTATAALFTAYTYDPLHRVLTSANAVGTTANVYSNWKVATTDPRGKEKDTYDDAYGNLVRVDEHNGASTYSTYYSYDGLHNLLSRNCTV